MLGRLNGIVPVAVALTALVAAAELSAQQVDEVRVTPSAAQIVVGERKSVVGTAYGANGGVISTARIVWTSTDMSRVRVEYNPSSSTVATLVGVAPGPATVEARAGRRVGTIAVQISGGGGVRPTVQRRVQGRFGSGPAAVLQVDPSQLMLLPGEAARLTPTFLRADGNLASAEPLTWSSLQSNIATVNDRGEVVALGVGGGLIQVSTAGGLSARVPVQVDRTAFAFADPVISMSPNTPDTVDVVVPLQNNRRMSPMLFQWQTTDPTIVAVSPLGVLMARSPGRAQIVASGFLQEQRMEVRVHRPVEELVVSPRMSEPAYVPLGGTRTFTVEALAADDTPVPEAVLIWSVRDTTIVSFDISTGVATGLKLGVDTLVVRAPGPGRLEATWELRVIAGGLKLSSRRAGFGIGDRLTVVAQFTDEEGTTISSASGVSWSTSDPGVVTVEGDGASEATITARDFGAAEVYVTTPWGSADTLAAFVQGEILVSSDRGGNNLDVFALERNAPTRLNRVTNDPGHDIAAVYSPDGTKIAYVSFVGGNKDIYVANADGSDRRNLTDSPSNEDRPAWTPDGNEIVHESDESGSAQIWVMNADGTGKRQLTQGPASNTQPAVNAAGTLIAFTSTRDNNYEIYTMSLDGSDQRNTTGSVERENSAAWFPDGSLAFIRGTEVVKIDRGMRLMITPSSLSVTDFAVSRTGDLLGLIITSLTADGQMSKLYLLPLSGTLAGALEVPSFNPSERFLSVSLRW